MFENFFLASAVVIMAGSGKRMYCANNYGNAKGICEAANNTVTVDEIITAVDHGVIKALIILGADIVKGKPGRDVEAVLEKLDFLVVGAPFRNETMQSADIILPEVKYISQIVHRA